MFFIWLIIYAVFYFIRKKTQLFDSEKPYDLKYERRKETVEFPLPFYLLILLRLSVKFSVDLLLWSDRYERA